jgi:hypothetical protein
VKKKLERELIEDIMQDKQSTQRTQHILEQLEDLSTYPQEPAPDVLRQITEFIVGLQEPYRAMGLKKIAEHIVSNMSLHVLALMVTFQQKAEEEGISLENRDEAIEHIKPVAFEILDKLSKGISIQSLDDIVALNNISVGLQTLSQSDSAEEAQSWLYELPAIYYRQLTQENLLVNVHIPEMKSSNVILSQAPPHFSWISFDTTQGIVLSGTGATQVTIHAEKEEAPIEVLVSLESDTMAVSYAA